MSCRHESLMLIATLLPCHVCAMMLMPLRRRFSAAGHAATLLLRFIADALLSFAIFAAASAAAAGYCRHTPLDAITPYFSPLLRLR